MAYPTRGRDPFLDAGTQAFLEQRGREAVGIFCMIASVILAVMLISHSASDSTYFMSGAGSAENWLGRAGATVSWVLLGGLGIGAWGIVILLFVWGLRTYLHAGIERSFGCLIYSPIFVFAMSMYGTSLVHLPDTGYQYQLGGNVGFSFFYFFLDKLPLSVTFMANLLSVLFGLATLGLGLFTCGVTLREMQTGFYKLCLKGSALVAWSSDMIGRRSGSEYAFDTYAATGADENPFANYATERPAELQRVVDAIRGNGSSTHQAQPRVSAPAVAQSTPNIMRAEPMLEPAALNVRAEIAGFAQPEDDRISQKIANAIRTKLLSPAPTAPQVSDVSDRAEPMLTRSLGPQPLEISTARVQPVVMEPTVTSVSAAG